MVKTFLTYEKIDFLMMNVNGNSLESHSQCSHYCHHFYCNLDYNYKSDPLPTGYKLESSILLQCAHYMKHFYVQP